jgi:hypothetical protein
MAEGNEFTKPLSQFIGLKPDVKIEPDGFEYVGEIIGADDEKNSFTVRTTLGVHTIPASRDRFFFYHLTARSKAKTPQEYPKKKLI